MSNICIIPARGGSKRIPKKNIKEFCGRPIISYSIEAALNSNIFDEVMVSTDTLEISKIAKSYGASVPYLRNKINSNDSATIEDVLHEVIKYYYNENRQFKYCCCLLPTAPFINSVILNDSYLKLEEYDSVIPVVKYPFPIQRAFQLKNNIVKFYDERNANLRSQDLEEMYHDAGLFYFFNISAFIENDTVLSDKAYGYIMPETKVRDIDTLEDWAIAEVLFRCLNLD